MAISLVQREFGKARRSMAQSRLRTRDAMAGSGANLTARDSATQTCADPCSLLLAVSPRHAPSCAHGAIAASAQALRARRDHAAGRLDDASFVAFRAALAAAAKSRIYAELAPLVLEHGFFWGRDFGQRFDPRRPPVDNLAAAIALEQGNGIGWDALAAFAAETAVEPLDSRPGVICAPARPDYDSVAFAKLLDVTYTNGIDWAYPRADETPVRAAPQPGRRKVGTLGRISSACSASKAPTANRLPAAPNGRASRCPTASRALSPPAA